MSAAIFSSIVLLSMLIIVTVFLVVGATRAALRRHN